MSCSTKDPISFQKICPQKHGVSSAWFEKSDLWCSFTKSSITLTLNNIGPEIGLCGKP